MNAACVLLLLLLEPASALTPRGARKRAKNTPTDAPPAAVLALPPAADGPHRITRHQLYEALDGAAAPPRVISTASTEELERMAFVGSVLATAGGEWPRAAAFSGASRTYDFGAPPKGAPPSPAQLAVRELPYDGAGVGHQVWSSAIVLALYLRSERGARLLREPPSGGGGGARVLEIGAGVGLPGLDLAQRGAAAAVTLTDHREPILASLRAASGAAAGAPSCEDVAGPSAAASGAAEVRVARLDWDDAASVASVAEGGFDVLIATDVVYREEDVASLVRCLRAVRAPLNLVAAPRSRAVVDALVSALGCEGGGGDGCRISERAFTLVDSDGAREATPGAGYAADYRVLVVRFGAQ